MTLAYDIGDRRRLTGTFRDITGALSNPSAIDMTIREPDGTMTNKVIGDLANPSVGVFTYDFTITQAGRHVCKFDATAGVVSASELEFWVRRLRAA